MEWSVFRGQDVWHERAEFVERVDAFVEPAVAFHGRLSAWSPDDRSSSASRAGTSRERRRERERLTRSDIPRTRERATDFDLSDPRPRLNWISKSRGCYYWTARGDEPWNTKSAYTNTIPVSTIASIPMKMKDKRYAVTNKSLGAIDS